jgi:hypothetical protein
LVGAMTTMMMTTTMMTMAQIGPPWFSTKKFHVSVVPVTG